MEKEGGEEGRGGGGRGGEGRGGEGGLFGFLDGFGFSFVFLLVGCEVGVLVGRGLRWSFWFCIKGGEEDWLVIGYEKSKEGVT